MIVLSGARIFDGENFLVDHAVVVEGERIAAIVPHAERPRGAVLDLGGGLLAPGYIDVQVNGGDGVLFNEEPTPEAIARIAAAHRKHGTVGLLPTLVTVKITTPGATRCSESWTFHSESLAVTVSGCGCPASVIATKPALVRFLNGTARVRSIRDLPPASVC